MALFLGFFIWGIFFSFLRVEGVDVDGCRWGLTRCGSVFCWMGMETNIVCRFGLILGKRINWAVEEEVEAWVFGQKVYEVDCHRTWKKPNDGLLIRDYGGNLNWCKALWRILASEDYSLSQEQRRRADFGNSVDVWPTWKRRPAVGFLVHSVS